MTLTHLPDDVVVLRGLNSPAALGHLSRSLAVGAVLETCRGLVVDLGGTTLDDRLLAALDEATGACLRRRQVVAFAADAGGTTQAVASARTMLRLLDREQIGRLAGEVAHRYSSLLAGAATDAFSLASVVVRRSADRSCRSLLDIAAATANPEETRDA